MLAKLLLMFGLLHHYNVNCGLNVVHQWNELEYVFPSEDAKQRAIQKEYYIQQPIENVPLDVDVDYTRNPRRLFITIPRFDSGRPVTLGTIDTQGRVVPYPDYSWHDNQGENCNGLTSVFRVFIDKCSRLWVLDAGKVGDNFACHPQVLAFDLSTDRLLYRHRFTKNVSYVDESLYITPVVDVKDCGSKYIKNTFVYAADVDGHSLGVVDVRRNESWRVKHPAFGPVLDKSTFTIAGETFELADGVLGLALSPYRGYDRRLYFHPLASTSEHYVSTSVIQDKINSQLPGSAVHTSSGQRPNQAAAEAMDDLGILYFGIMDPPSVLCWNSKTQFKPENFHPIDVNQNTLQFASGIKVVKNPWGGRELWVFTSRFQKVMTGSMTADEINFRILTTPLTNQCLV